MKTFRSLTTYVVLFLLCTLSSAALAQTSSRDETIFFFNDAQGSAVAAINESGDLCWREEYTAYGDKNINDDLVSEIGCGIIGEERGFTGHTEDVNSDLVYMQQRYYDPSIGRFLSIDPMDVNPNVPQTYNRYAYANNNPYKYVDPDGELPVLAYIAYAGVTAALATYDSYSAYQEGGVGAFASQAATNLAMSAIPGLGSVKTAKNATAIVEKIAEKVDVSSSGGKTFQTYTKTNPETGQVYCGRTSGCGTPEQNMARRDANHHRNQDGYGPAVLDKSSTNSAAIRGREQQLIDAHGGAQSTGGTSGNKINGISNSNKNRDYYLDQANREFGG